MTSRPGPAIQENLQRRGSGAGVPRAQVRRRPSRPVNNPHHAVQQDCIDPSLDDPRRSADEAVNKPRVHAATKPKPVVLEHIRTSTSDTARPPPKGKPQLFFSTEPEHALPSQSNNISAPLPIPPRPGVPRPSDSLQQHRILPGGTGVKGSAAVKPPSNDPPPAAAVFPGGKTVDLFPWTGNNPEDMLTEALVKGGVSNKPQIMNETNTARPSLWTNLKGKNGLTNLSMLFVAVLEKRQACGRLTTQNSFKPPPRLTLRDSTREAWLHDLANPAVGLRRLSRTIPHGITGKVLLEQCLNKHIPLPRAVWLAKCVGINEMRSHQRKGQAGAITWVRGWTSSVEQFLDGNIGTVGQQDWKPRITYALQLATALYKEHLLEEEHFLDWILKSLDSCSQERLFLWLLISSLYGPDLTACRRRGRRFAESLLNHAERLYSDDDDEQTSPLIQYLEKILLKLLSTSPECLLLPKIWEKYTLVTNRLSTRHSFPHISRTIRNLDARCKRLLRTSQPNRTSTQNSTKEVLHVLDAINFEKSFNVEKLATQCMSIASDTQTLISVLLQWACSIYREGCHRVYFVTRLLRKLNQFGADVDNGILSYLQSMVSRWSQEPRNLYRIVAELVRSKTFSIGKYLQWLIATGSISTLEDSAETSNWSFRVVTEIPLSGLSEQVRNLRSTLLRGTAHATDGEEERLDDAESILRSQLPSLTDISMEEDSTEELDTASLSSTLKLELAIMLRQLVASSVSIVDHVPTKDPSVDESAPVCAISPQDFHVVRSYLEDFGDLSILADIIGVTTTSLDANVLASAADTLNYNHKAFKAIGAFEPLLQKIAMRYAAIRTARFPERELLLSLLDLAQTAKVEGHLTQALTYDLSRHDQKTSIAACSPVSDTMADVLYTANVDSDEEIDRILGSGTSMDQQIMSRIFVKIVQNLEECIKTSTLPPGNHAVWFYRLRNFDEGFFDSILADWLPSIIANRQAKLLHASLPPLVVSGCTTLMQFYEISNNYLGQRKGSDLEETLRICITMLDLLLPSERPSTLCQPQEAYKFRLEQQKFCRGSKERVLRLVRETLDAGSKTFTAGSRSHFQSFLSSNRLRTVVKHCALQSSHMLSASLGIGAQSNEHPVHSSLKTLLDGLLDPSNHLGLSKHDLAQQIKIVVDCADHLSLPFCQLEIQQLFALDAQSTDATTDAIPSSLLEAIKGAVEKDDSPWSALVAGLDDSLTAKIREHAERELLSASASLSSTKVGQPVLPEKNDEAFIQKYLTVIDSTTLPSETESQTPIFMPLVERFKGVLDTLTKAIGQPKDAQSKDLSQTTQVLCTWLNAFLRLAVVHGSISLHKAPSQHQAALLWSLRLLLTHPALEAYPSITGHIYDVAIFLSDFISDDVRSHLMKMDAGKPTDDARCAFIFGSNSAHDGWLALARPVPASGTASSQSQTTSTSSPNPQTPHSSHSSSPQSQTQNQGPASLQRSLSQQQLQQLQAQAQSGSRMYQQHSQSQQSKLLAQFQRLPAGQNESHNQLRQLQQMQQMQSLAQQRSTQPSPVQLQRQQSHQGNLQSKTSASAKAEKVEMRTYPFQLKRWEILPEGGGNPAGNETAISLSLFGARKV